jgi:uncharacterized protein with PIN domain
MLVRLTAGYRFRFRTLATLAPGLVPQGDPLEAVRGQAGERAASAEQALLERYCEARDVVRAALLGAGGGLRAAWRTRTARAGGFLAEPVGFVCDASLGGLARWLRAAGHPAQWRDGATALARVADAVKEGRVLVTTDSRVLALGAIRDGRLPTLWLPSNLTRDRQLGLVLGDLDLDVLAARCMACSGELACVEKEAVLDRIPPRTALWKDTYFVCRDCARLYWQGTHWERIQARLHEVGRRKHLV